MKCTDATEYFSDYIEGELVEPELARIESHLASCEACRSSLESFRYTLGDLQSLSLRETSRSEVGAIMAAVDAATAVQARPRRTVLTHLAAALLGAVLFWILWPADVRIEERVVVQRMEVPIEVQVEVPVERIVQVEVPIEVAVEVPVEVERVVERVVEVPVERRVVIAHPLQARADRFLAFSDAVVELASLAAAPIDEVEPEPAAERSISNREPERVARVLRNAPVRVVRADDRVTFQTHGSTAEVVPALIAMLTDEDFRTRRSAAERLERYRSELGGELPAPEGREPTAFAKLKSFVGASAAEDDQNEQLSASESWRAWWNARSGALAALDSQIAY